MPAVRDEGFSFGISASADNLDGIQLGLVSAGVDGKFDGVQAASVFCNVNGTADGMQLSGVYNNTDGDMDGFQISGVWNAVEGDLQGAQMGGVWNYAGNVGFLQLAGVFNTAEEEVNGVQVAGIFNKAGGDVVGVQTSGIFNIAGNITGAQVAGIFNTADVVTGAQVGLFNFGGEVYGIQAGLVNISDELHGVPLGLINISGNGLNDLSMWRDDLGYLNAGYQLGTSTVYSYMSIGLTEDDADRAATAGLGMGIEIGGDFLFLDLDFYAKAYEEGTGTMASNFQNIFTGRADYFPAMRLTAGFELFGFLGMFAGVNLDCRVVYYDYNYGFDIGSGMAASYPDTTVPFAIDFGGGNMVEMYPTWFLGIRI